jgi:hypothetical protein
MKQTNSKLFIQKLVEHEKTFEHVGFTHDLLSIPYYYNLGHAKSLLRAIVKAPIGSIVKNPIKHIGKPRYQVTKELKQHVNAALNLITISQKFHAKKRALAAKRMSK